MKNMMFSSNENIDYSQSTKKTFGSRKVFLLIMACLATVSDFALLIVFAISGHGGIAIPVILLILDALFITGVCLSNFRFKYSIGIWVAYLVVSVIVTSILATLEPNGETYMTTTARCLNVFSHLALYLVTVFASIYPLLKNNVKIKAIMVTSVAIAVILVGAFAVYFSANGYFGQGFLNEYRVVGYTLDEDSDTYIASSVKMGRSKKVVIPSEFNGKKVSGVNCSIFTYSSVDTIEIQTQEKIDLIDTHLLAQFAGMRVGVDKKYIDNFREEYLKQKTPVVGTYKFANSLYPIHLDNDERYITFAYEDYTEQDDIIPTWIGKKGQTFELDYADVDYLQHVDAQSADDLIWCYDNNDAQILTGQTVKLAGSKINESVDCVNVKFEGVYRTEIVDDNDDLYEPADSFKTTVSNNTLYAYRYFTFSGAINFIENLGKELIEDRDYEFYLNWQYNANSISDFYHDFSWHYVELDTLKLLVDHKGNELDIKLKPVWELKKPTKMKITLNKSNYVYGDDVIAQVSAQAPNDVDYVLEYDWSYNFNGISVGRDGTEYTINNAYPQDGTFNVKVTVSSNKTSLTSYDYVEEKLVVNKRPLHINWTVPTSEDMVYNGNEKVLTYQVKDGDLINGDKLTNYLNVKDVKNTNAGSYTAVLALTGSINEKYVIEAGAKQSYTIAPLHVETQWTSGDFTYDGNTHNATATAQGIGGYNVPIKLSEAKINAGEHTATATSANTNYVLTNNTYKFEIKQKPVTVSWSSSNITYDGYAQYPRVSAINGLVGNDNITGQLIYSGYASNIDAGEGYSVSVALPSTSNYKFDTTQSTQYNIAKKALRIYPLVANKTYDGRAISLDFMANGLASVDSKSSLGTPTYGGDGVGAVNQGSYTVTVSLPVNAVTRNYEITYISADFTISKAQVALTWSNATVSGGRVTAPSVVTSGQVYTGDISISGYTYRDSTGRVINSIPYASGTYSVEVTVTSLNYSFTNTRINFTITEGQVRTKEVA